MCWHCQGLHVEYWWFLLGYMLRPFCRNQAMRILKWVNRYAVAVEFCFCGRVDALGGACPSSCVCWLSSEHWEETRETSEYIGNKRHFLCCCILLLFV